MQIVIGATTACYFLTLSSTNTKKMYIKNLPWQKILRDKTYIENAKLMTFDRKSLNVDDNNDDEWKNYKQLT